MRTTLDIDDDVLLAAKDLARREKKSVGQIISELARKGLAGTRAATTREPNAIAGLRLFLTKARIVSNELIDKLREDGESQRRISLTDSRWHYTATACSPTPRISA